MKYFTLAELCNSVSAVKFGIDNTPNKDVADSLTALVDNLLDPLREQYGKPIKVTSGYRSPKLNRVVRGAPNSQHMAGEAVDITCEDNKKLFDLIKANFEYDQLIWEKGDDRQPDWVHVSYTGKRKNRKQIIKIK